MASTSFLLPATTNNLSMTSSSRPVIYTRRLQIEMWEEDVRFYEHLLTWLRLSCKEESEREIEALHAQLSVLKGKDLPKLKQERNIPYTIDELDCFYFFEESLRQIKLKIFHGFSKFIHVAIK